MYYGPIPHSPSHMNPQEVVSYPLQGFGSSTTPGPVPPELTPREKGEVLGVTIGAGISLFASFVAPILVGYGVYKRGHGLGLSALAWFGSGFIISPVAFLLPFGAVLTTGAAAYYAAKD